MLSFDTSPGPQCSEWFAEAPSGQLKSLGNYYVNPDMPWANRNFGGWNKQ